MKYIRLGYIEPATLGGMTKDTQHALLDECFEHNDHLRANLFQRSTSLASGDRINPVLEKRQSRDEGWTIPRTALR